MPTSESFPRNGPNLSAWSGSFYQSLHLKPALDQQEYPLAGNDSLTPSAEWPRTL